MSRRTVRLSIAPAMAMIMLVALTAAFAQSPGRPAPAPSHDPIKLTLADGRVISAQAVRRSRDTLLATVTLAAGVKGDVGNPISNIRKIEMPEPPQLKVVRGLLAAGKPGDALAPITVATNAQNDLRTIPGNWWAPAALLKVDVLIALKRDREAEALIKQLDAGTKDTEVLQKARMALAMLWVRSGRSDEAIAVFDETIAVSKNSTTLARAWVNRGDAELAKRDYDAALLAYLRVPVFYSGETAVLPAAFLGSARAYEGLGDSTRARSVLDALTEQFPNSPEAVAAKADAARIDKRLNPTESE